MKIKNLLWMGCSTALFASCTPPPRPTTESQAPTVKTLSTPTATAATPKLVQPLSAARPKGRPAPALPPAYALSLIDSASLGSELVLTREMIAVEKSTARDSLIQRSASDSNAEERPDFVSGYRVQIYATTDFKEAERKKEDLTSTLDEKVYVIYEAPFYKLRVGNFLKEDDGKKLRKRLTELGLDTWLVKSPIRAKD